MKKSVFILFVGLLLLGACAPPSGGGPDATQVTAVLVTAGENQQSFSVEDLQALPPAEATFNNVAYKGVTVSALLGAVGLNPNDVKAIKAVAADGYAVNFDPAQVLKDNVVLAYAMADGNPLSAEDGNFRMVLPDEEGKLNVRMLVELQFIQ